MSYLPEVNRIRKKQLVQQEFRGINHNVFLADTELYDMKNMSSRHYPYASPRTPRGVFKDTNGNAFGNGVKSITNKQGMCFCKDGYFYYKDKTDNKYKRIFAVSNKEKNFISSGAYLLIFPDKLYFNTFAYDNWNQEESWWKERGMTKPDNYYGSIEANASFNWIRISMCNVDGDIWSFDYVQPTEPENPTNGIIWLDTSAVPAKIMQYSSVYSGWVEIVSTYVRVTVPGAINNFFDYDGVTLSGFPEALKEYNGSTVMYKSENCKDLASDSRNLYVNGAVQAKDDYITFDGGTVANDELIGRKIVIDKKTYKVTDNTTTQIYVDRELPAIADDTPIEPEETYFVITGLLDFEKCYGKGVFYDAEHSEVFYITEAYELEKTSDYFAKIYGYPNDATRLEIYDNGIEYTVDSETKKITKATIKTIVDNTYCYVYCDDAIPQDALRGKYLDIVTALDNYYEGNITGNEAATYDSDSGKYKCKIATLGIILTDFGPGLEVLFRSNHLVKEQIIHTGSYTGIQKVAEILGFPPNRTSGVISYLPTFDVKADKYTGALTVPYITSASYEADITITHTGGTTETKHIKAFVSGNDAKDRLPSDQAYAAEDPVLMQRKVPDMDYVCESNGRIWGCNNNFHEIYASQIGFPFNFNVFLGLSTDSYSATIGSDGNFTGCIAFMGYILFFKEDRLHKVFGTKPSNYQLTELTMRGVQSGCDKSLSILNDTLFYKSKTGIMAFNGTVAENISEVLGTEPYTDAVAASCNNKYYVSMKNSSNTYDLFVYDSKLGFWHKEDNTQFKTAYSLLDELVFIDGNNRLCTVNGTGTSITVQEPTVVNDTPTTIDTTYSIASEGAVEWSMESGDLYLGSIDNKYISRLRILFKIFKDTKINVYLKYDNDSKWTYVATKTYKYTDSTKNTYNLPINSRRSRRLMIKITGTGDCDIQAIAMDVEKGSEI